MKTDAKKHIGEVIRKKRVEYGLSQQKLAEKSGININTISNLERGCGSKPSLVTLVKIADYFDISIDYLIGRTNNEQYTGQSKAKGLRILKNSQTPVSEQLSEQLRTKIISGELKEGEELISIRELSINFKISGYTVLKAYKTLISEGLVVLDDKVYKVKKSAL